MNKKYLPSLVCGFGAAVLTIIPGFSSFACCFIVPIAAVVSVTLYKKSNPDILKIQTGSGVVLGLLTGLYAAIFASGFEIIITYVTKSNDLVLALPQTENLLRGMNLGPAVEDSIKLMKQMITDIRTKGFSFMYSILITLSNSITFSIFGILGGVLGTAIINRRNKPVS
jgi:hypothetical protein